VGKKTRIIFERATYVVKGGICHGNVKCLSVWCLSRTRR